MNMAAGKLACVLTGKKGVGADEDTNKDGWEKLTAPGSLN